MINPATTRTFHRTLYAGMLMTVALLKRNNDQQQGTVRRVSLFEVRQGMVFKDGEPIQGDMTSNHRCIFHIPKIALEAAGVAYINAADRIDNTAATFGVPGVWEVESTTEEIVKLFGNHICCHCLRVDPPAS